MDLFSFLNLIKLSKVADLNVISFYSATYPPLFLSQFYAYLKQRSVPLTNIDMLHNPSDNIYAKLSMSFLSNRICYVLKDFNSLNASDKQQWVNYLKTYNGPHTILLFNGNNIGLSESSKQIEIELPQKIQKDLYKELFLLFYPEFSYNPLFTKKIFENQPTILLDTACRLMSYQSVLGKSSDTFFVEWADKLIGPEKSLFSLSQSFFGQQLHNFFEYWLIYKHDYAEEFWIAFWSEQIWQAISYILTLDQHGINEAKKNSRGLPFSFMNKDWSRYSPDFLMQAYQALYQLDFNFKNGGSYGELEFWYYKFLLNRF